eukprot:6415765-Prymnesium_polylepis.1
MGEWVSRAVVAPAGEMWWPGRRGAARSCGGDRPRERDLLADPRSKRRTPTTYQCAFEGLCTVEDLERPLRVGRVSVCRSSGGRCERLGRDYRVWLLVA